MRGQRALGQLWEHCTLLAGKRGEAALLKRTLERQVLLLRWQRPGFPVSAAFLGDVCSIDSSLHHPRTRAEYPAIHEETQVLL